MNRLPAEVNIEHAPLLMSESDISVRGPFMGATMDAAIVTGVKKTGGYCDMGREMAVTRL